MKKTFFAFLAAALAFGLLADTRVFTSGDSYVYTLDLMDNKDVDGNPYYAAELLEIAYQGGGTNRYALAADIDLAGIDKELSVLERELAEESGVDIPVRLVNIADFEAIWSDKERITSVSFPASFEDIVGVIPDLQGIYPNLRDISISGEGDYTTYDGVVYTADLKELVYCPQWKTSVDIPSTCTTLPDYAFSSCHQLATVTGGAGLLYVGRNAFGETSDDAIARGESPVAAPAIPFVRSFPTNAFMTVDRVVFGFRGVPPNRLVVPAGTRAIADGAFADLKFARVEFVGADASSSLRWVGQGAFEGNALNDAGILDGVIFNFGGKADETADPAAWSDRKIIALADSAYEGNTAITNITIPASVEEIGDRCFADCPSLEAVTFLGTPDILGAEIFAGCPKLKTVRFEQALMPPCEVDEDLYSGSASDLVTYVPGSASRWPADEEGNWCARALSRSIQVIAQEGVYGKWTLAELGVTLPKVGTVFTPKAYGLPSGLVLKSNKAVKNKKGKITTKAKTSWWIEGVPLEALDYATRPAYIVVTLNGMAVWQPIQLEVRELEPAGGLSQLQVNEVAEDFALPEVGKGWSVSGLPAGLKFATKAITKKVRTKVKGRTKTVTQTLHRQYVVYGTPTQAGEFVVTAKKKMSNGYYSLKKFWLDVADLGGTPTEGPEIVSGFTGGDEIRTATLGLSDAFAAIEVADGTTLTASGLPKGVTLKLVDGKYVFDGVPSSAGTYYVTLTATKNGRKIVRCQPIRIEKLPSWVQGSYNGYIGFHDSIHRPALVTMAVSSAGKVSGKFTSKGRIYTISRTGLSDLEDGETPEERSCKLRDVVAVYVPVDAKGRKVTSKAETIALGDLVFSDGECGVTVAATVDENLIYWEMQQNRWASDYQQIGTSLQLVTHAWTIKNPGNPNNWVKIAFDRKGVVKGTMQVPTGLYTKKKVGKKTVNVEVMYTATCSSVLMPQTPAADGAAAFDGVIRLVFPAGTKKVGKKTFTFEGVTFSETYGNLFSYTLAEDAWETGTFVARAEAVLPGLARTTFTYTGTLSVRVGDDTAATRPYIATFKPDGYSPIDFSGKFTPVKKDGEIISYRARPQVTFPNGTTRIIELTINPYESESGGLRGLLDAVSFGDAGDGDYFTTVY